MATATDTRARILDAAERLILRRGFGATSLDAVVDRVGLTKGAFFHHFDSKEELARALIRRHAAADRAHLAAHLERAEAASPDPLRQVLALVDSYAETMDRLAEPYPGCLFASYCYQQGIFDEEINELVRDGLRRWREVLGGKLRAAMDRRPPRSPVQPEELADTFLATAEGAFVLSKSLGEPGVVAEQLRRYRHYLELLFDVR